MLQQQRNREPLDSVFKSGEVEGAVVLYTSTLTWQASLFLLRTATIFVKEVLFYIIKFWRFNGMEQSGCISFRNHSKVLYTARESTTGQPAQRYSPVRDSYATLHRVPFPPAKTMSADLQGTSQTEMHTSHFYAPDKLSIVAEHEVKLLEKAMLATVEQLKEIKTKLRHR